MPASERAPRLEAGLRLGLVLLVAAALIPAGSRPASACSCVAQTREVYAEQADVVFTGVAASVAEEESRLVTRFDVAVAYKGKAQPERFLYSGNQEGACGVRFQEAVKYSVFAGRLDDGKLWTSSCSGNKQGRIRHARYGLPRGHRF